MTTTNPAILTGTDAATRGTRRTGTLPRQSTTVDDFAQLLASRVEATAATKLADTPGMGPLGGDAGASLDSRFGGSIDARAAGGSIDSRLGSGVDARLGGGSIDARVGGGSIDSRVKQGQSGAANVAPQALEHRVTPEERVARSGAARGEGVGRPAEPGSRSKADPGAEGNPPEAAQAGLDNARANAGIPASGTRKASGANGTDDDTSDVKDAADVKDEDETKAADTGATASVVPASATPMSAVSMKTAKADTAADGKTVTAATTSERKGASADDTSVATASDPAANAGPPSRPTAASGAEARGRADSSATRPEDDATRTAIAGQAEQAAATPKTSAVRLDGATKGAAARKPVEEMDGEGPTTAAPPAARAIERNLGRGVSAAARDAARPSSVDGSTLGDAFAMPDAASLETRVRAEPGLSAIPSAVPSAIHSVLSGSVQTPAAAAPVVYTLATPVGSPRWSEDFAEIVSVSVRDKVQEAEIRLDPRDLGPITMRVTMDGDVATLAFSATHPETQARLEGGLDRLRESLAEAGIQLGNATVDGGNAQSDRQAAAQSRSAPLATRLAQEQSFAGDAARGRPASRGPSLVDTFA